MTNSLSTDHYIYPEGVNFVVLSFLNLLFPKMGPSSEKGIICDFWLCNHLLELADIIFSIKQYIVLTNNNEQTNWYYTAR